MTHFVRTKSTAFTKLAALLVASSALLALPALAQSTTEGGAAGAAPDASVQVQRDPAGVVARVGEREITNADLDQALADMAQQFRSFPEAERRARALDSIIDIHVLAGEARKIGLDKQEALARRIDFLTERALHNAFFQTNIAPSVSDEDLRKRYDAEVAKTTPEQEVRARHILVKTEDEAKAIIAALDGGADFETLAKEKSTGPSGPQGGDLGYFQRGRMVPEFEKAAFAMEAGAYTKEPVKTQFGFHVIKVEDKRDRPLPTFEQTKDRLRQLVLTERYAEAVQAGRTAANVEVTDESLKLPEPAPQQ